MDTPNNACLNRFLPILNITLNNSSLGTSYLDEKASFNISLVGHAKSNLLQCGGAGRPGSQENPCVIFTYFSVLSSSVVFNLVDFS